MARPRKYRYLWEDIAYLHADHVKRWGAFDGYRGPVAFDNGGVAGARWEHDECTDRVSLLYEIRGDVQRGDFGLHRQPSPLGGERILFSAPCCGTHALRLALLAEGVRCGACGSVIRASYRANPARRAVMSAEKSAAALDLTAWNALPSKRPGSMHPKRFARLCARHATNVARADRLLAPRVEALKRLGAAGEYRAALAVAAV